VLKPPAKAVASKEAATAVPAPGKQLLASALVSSFAAPPLLQACARANLLPDDASVGAGVLLLLLLFLGKRDGGAL
jgi:hypothetical protein